MRRRGFASFERSRAQRLADVDKRASAISRAVCSACGQRVEVLPGGALALHMTLERDSADVGAFVDCTGAAIVRGRKARKPLPRKRARQRRTSRVVDEEYLAIVRTLPCCASRLDGHDNADHGNGCDPHHVTHLGLGAMGDDIDAVPLFRTCHNAVHAGAGPFRDWTKARRERWLVAQIADTRRRVAEVRAGRVRLVEMF